MSKDNWPHFSKHELVCRCGECDFPGMDETFMHRLERLRTQLDFPFVLNSAYRCPDYNNRVSSTGFDGPHTTGRAVDIRVYGVRAQRIIEAMWPIGFTGLGVGQKGSHETRFLHLDDLTPEVYHGPRPRVWSY